MICNSMDFDFKLFDKPVSYYQSMINDIENAKKYVYLEIYRFNNDPEGAKFRDVLAKKAKQGIEVKLLLDSWGTSTGLSFFMDIIKNGGEVRFFKKIKFFFDFFTKNHRRNHKKLLIIDDKISYIGSGNIAAYSIDWRELMLRLHSDIALHFKKIFLYDYKNYNKYKYNQRGYFKNIKFQEFTILRDRPSIVQQRIRRKFIKLIKTAEKNIIIETPYFLPGYKLRKALADAGKKGVDVKILTPKYSDVRIVDILRDRYLGKYYINNVKILFFLPVNLHSKLLMIDNKTFLMGSSNFDYRSSRYQHEICLMGTNKNIIKSLNKHISVTLKYCEHFNYEEWLKRPLILRFYEWLLLPLRYLL